MNRKTPDGEKNHTQTYIYKNPVFAGGKKKEVS